MSLGYASRQLMLIRHFFVSPCGEGFAEHLFVAFSQLDPAQR
jgi:hypothetical protein